MGFFSTLKNRARQPLMAPSLPMAMPVGEMQRFTPPQRWRNKQRSPRGLSSLFGNLNRLRAMPTGPTVSLPNRGGMPVGPRELLNEFGGRNREKSLTPPRLPLPPMDRVPFERPGFHKGRDVNFLDSLARQAEFQAGKEGEQLQAEIDYFNTPEGQRAAMIGGGALAGLLPIPGSKWAAYNQLSKPIVNLSKPIIDKMAQMKNVRSGMRSGSTGPRVQNISNQVLNRPPFNAGNTIAGSLTSTARALSPMSKAALQPTAIAGGVFALSQYPEEMGRLAAQAGQTIDDVVDEAASMARQIGTPIKEFVERIKQGYQSEIGIIREVNEQGFPVTHEVIDGIEHTTITAPRTLPEPAELTISDRAKLDRERELNSLDELIDDLEKKN